MPDDYESEGIGSAVGNHVNFLRIRKSNPMFRAKRPIPVFKEPGDPYGDNYKHPFYAVPELEYRKKKEAILQKYQKALDKQSRKEPNHSIDFKEMEKLLNQKVKIKDIALLLNTTPSNVSKYKAKLILIAKQGRLKLKKPFK